MRVTCGFHSCNLQELSIDLHVATEQTAAAGATIFVAELYLNVFGVFIKEMEANKIAI